VKIAIELAMLVRQTKIVTVEVPDDFDSWTESAQEDLMGAVYAEDEGVGFDLDSQWGCEEGTHSLVGKSNDAPEWRVDEDLCPEKIEP